MKFVNPEVYLISIPEDTGAMTEFLEKSGVTWRPDPDVSWTENVMEFAGRLCYWSFESEDGFENKNLTRIRSGNKDYLGNIIKAGHLSVFEHNGPLTILFSNVSRVFANELVRHRAGCAYSQTSGRYVRTDDISFWVPPTLQNADVAKSLSVIEAELKRIEDVLGIDAMKDFKDKKIATSALRRLAPNGQANNILMSCNHRALRHIIELRTSEHAEEEMRICFGGVAKMMKRLFPSIYQDMYEEDGSWKFGSQ